MTALEQLKEVSRTGGEAGEQEDETLIFTLKLSDPIPNGVKTSKKNVCYIEVVPDQQEIRKE